MDISIIIPNYNGEKLLDENLSSVVGAFKDYESGKVQIIIPDDASSDNSRKVINDFISSFKSKNITILLIENNDKKDRGFSKNVNRGVKSATGEILILLNSDVVPYKNFLPPLLKHFEDKKVFAVGCMDESVEEGNVVLRGRGIGRWQRGFFVHAKGEINRHNTLWVSGGSGAFRKSIWDKLGGMDVLYNPYYWEDIDLSYRALKSGYKIIFEKKSVVKHEHGKGAIMSQNKPVQVRIIAYRNQFIFIWKNITDVNLLLSHIFWMPYYIWKALIAGDYAFLFGLISAKVRILQIIQSRQKAKRNFIQSDKEVLKDFTA